MSYVPHSSSFHHDGGGASTCVGLEPLPSGIGSSSENECNL